MYKNESKNYPYYNVRPLDNLRQLVDETALIFGDKPIVRYKVNGEEKKVTYREFKGITDAYGTGLCNVGLNGKHIAIVCENRYEWFLSYVTLLVSNNVVVPVDKDLTDEETEYILNSADCSAVIYSQYASKKLARLKNAGVLPNISDYICVDACECELVPNYTIPSLISLGNELLEKGNRKFTTIAQDTKCLKQLMFTSGTTGRSKGVMLSQENLCFNIVGSQQLMHITETCLSVLPYHHTYEATCGLLTMMHNGMTICINESLKPTALVANFKYYKPTEVQLVPLMVELFYNKIWDSINRSGKAFKVKAAMKASNALLSVGIDVRKRLFKEILDNFGGELLIIICGGAPLKPHLPAFFDSIGITLINGYGITECGPLISINRPSYHNYASVGLPLKDTEVMIDNPNERGEGEICVKGKNVMLGYYKNKKATDEAIRDGWFHTGDIGKKDENGFIFITGRIKNIIVLSNGKNIYPEEIEEVIGSIDLISEVVIYGAKDGNNAEKSLGAEIFPNFTLAKERGITDVEAAIRKEINAYNQKQPTYRIIKQIKFRTVEFEKTTSRKIKRSAISN